MPPPSEPADEASTPDASGPGVLGEQVRLVVYVVRWIVLGIVSGLLAGVSSAVFLHLLNWATDTRERNGWLLWLLPLAGFVTGWVYLKVAGRAAEGNALLIDEIHEPSAWVPRRMAPLIFVATIVTHLFGGSAGREGTAVQMSGSLSDAFARIVRLDARDRRILLIAAISGGFGAMFGVPLAGTIFGLEVQAVGRIRYDALVPALAASITGDLIVKASGYDHLPYPSFPGLELSALLVLKAAAAGVVFGLCGALFIEVTHLVKRQLVERLRWAPLRPVVGGLAVIGLTYLAGTRAYLGLSTPLVVAAFGGAALTGAFAWKLLFTSVTLGSGFQGGEVTPLFVMGATLGSVLAHPLGLPVPLGAALGFVAVFAGAANTPLTCTVMGAELFGSTAVVPVAVACIVSYVFSSHRSIYGSQRIEVPKFDVGIEVERVGDVHRRWWPARFRRRS